MCPEQTLDERRQEVEKTKGEGNEGTAATLKQTRSHTCSHTFRDDLGDLRSVSSLHRATGFLGLALLFSDPHR